MSECFFNGKKIPVDCEVKVLTDGSEGDIISQYVRFCAVFNDQVRRHGRTRKAVEETIRVCRDEDVLAEYLERQREEVIDIMLTLFDEETIMRNHDAAVERRGEKRGEKRGEERGRRDTTALMAYLATNGRTEDIVRASVDDAFLDLLLEEFRAGEPTSR